MKKTYARALAVCLAIALLCAVSINCTHDTMRNELTMSPVAQMTPSEVAWTDNFDDENVSDWQLIGANMTTDPGVVVPANYSFSGGAMWFRGPTWNFIIHNSSVAYGTWTFSVDLQKPTNADAFYVAFIGSQYSDDWL